MIQEKQTMDRPLDTRYRRVQLRKRWLLALLVIAGVCLVYVIVFSLLVPSIHSDEIHTVRVEYGPVQSVLSATGIIVPEFEQVLPSPVDARVLQIVKRAGDSISPHDSIVRLDVSDIRLQLAQVKDRIALKRNARLQVRAQTEGQLIKLANTIAAKQRDITLLTVKDEQNRASWEKQFISHNEMLESAQAVAQAQTDLESLRKEQRNIKTTGQLQEEGLVVEIAMLEKEQAEYERQLELATTKANRQGVLTWVVQTEGAMVHKGDVLARIADLSSYRVQATISDAYASQIAVGMPVQVQLNEATANETSIEGRVSSIQPAVENGKLNLFIGLARGTQSMLRPNLRVDVAIVTERKARALRVKKEKTVQGKGMQTLFVLRDGKAVRRTVTLGMVGVHYCEVVDGLREGELLISSDMRDYMHMESIAVQ